MSFGDNWQRPVPEVEQEPTGPIAKDSLAAESIRGGGDFGENENAEPLGVRGDQSTLNTTDTSGATSLRAAADAPTRYKEDLQGLGSDERGHTGVKYPDADAPSGADSGGSAQAFSGGTGDSFASGGRSGGDSFDPDKVSSSAPRATLRTEADDDRAAPNYVGTVTGGIHAPGEFQPKGRDLHEGDIPATKTFTGDVGGPNDPGRLAEQRFEQRNAEGLVESGDKQYKGNQGSGSADDNPYDVLESERA